MLRLGILILLYGLAGQKACRAVTGLSQDILETIIEPTGLTVYFLSFLLSHDSQSVDDVGIIFEDCIFQRILGSSNH